MAETPEMPDCDQTDEHAVVTFSNGRVVLALYISRALSETENMTACFAAGSD